MRKNVMDMIKKIVNLWYLLLSGRARARLPAREFVQSPAIIGREKSSRAPSGRGAHEKPSSCPRRWRRQVGHFSVAADVGGISPWQSMGRPGSMDSELERRRACWRAAGFTQTLASSAASQAATLARAGCGRKPAGRRNYFLIIGILSRLEWAELHQVIITSTNMKVTQQTKNTHLTEPINSRFRWQFWSPFSEWYWLQHCHNP